MARSASSIPLLIAVCLGLVAGCLLLAQRGSSEEARRTALLEFQQVDPSRQQRLRRFNQLDDDTPFWMGFRSSIDGYNANQSPNTFPGGAQDQQEPVAYPYPWTSANGNGAVPAQNTAMTGGGVNVQGKGLRTAVLEETYPFAPPAAWDSDPKHGFGGYGGGTNAGAYEANPGGSYYCADCTW